MATKKISTFEEFNEALVQTEKLFLLKNSTTCPISAVAFEEFANFAEELDEDALYLNVQEARPLSNKIAEQFQVKHESPQALLFKNGNVLWHASHWDVTYSSLREQWKNS